MPPKEKTAKQPTIQKHIDRIVPNLERGFLQSKQITCIQNLSITSHLPIISQGRLMCKSRGGVSSGREKHVVTLNIFYVVQGRDQHEVPPTAC